MLIIIATNRAQEIQDFITPLKQMNDAEIAIVQTGAITLEKVKSESPTFVIVDEGLADFEPLALVNEIVKINAMINTAVVSPLNHDDFHEASEGLGVLAPIPTTPKGEDGIQLAELFSRFI
jgi:DNA-binding response OmpR family regulator